MIEQILVPLDGSTTAEAALPYAAFLARAFNVPIELLQALDVSPSAYRSLPQGGENSNAEDEVRVRSYLERTAGRLLDSRVSLAVERGKPAEAIIEKAAAREKTLIVMASHGRSGIQRWLLGSVAENVLRAARSPVLLVRAGARAEGEKKPLMDSVTVGLDGSLLAESVLPLAAAIARQTGIALSFLRAYELPASAYYGSEDYLPNYEDLKDELKRDVENYLAQKVESAQAHGVGSVSASAVEGEGPAKIVSYARERPNTLLALCTHGRSGVKRWLLGSVTENVVRHSRNPVLVLRAA